jgi:hypothetical protein
MAKNLTITMYVLSSINNSITEQARGYLPETIALGD